MIPTELLQSAWQDKAFLICKPFCFRNVSVPTVEWLQVKLFFLLIKRLAEQSAMSVRTQFTIWQWSTALSLCAYNKYCYLPACGSPHLSLLRFHQIVRQPGRPAGNKSKQRYLDTHAPVSMKASGDQLKEKQSSSQNTFNPMQLLLQLCPFMKQKF